jgi:hypothetical protein
LEPLAEIVANQRLAREALGQSGRQGVLAICVVAGLASVIWRHDSFPIGIGGGVIVAGLLLVRTGAYREYLTAIETIHGFPPLTAVLRYNSACLRRTLRALWRR